MDDFTDAELKKHLNNISGWLLCVEQILLFIFNILVIPISGILSMYYQIIPPFNIELSQFFLTIYSFIYFSVTLYFFVTIFLSCVYLRWLAIIVNPKILIA